MNFLHHRTIKTAFVWVWKCKERDYLRLTNLWGPNRTGREHACQMPVTVWRVDTKSWMFSQWTFLIQCDILGWVSLHHFTAELNNVFFLCHDISCVISSRNPIVSEENERSDEHLLLISQIVMAQSFKHFVNVLQHFLQLFPDCLCQMVHGYVNIYSIDCRLYKYSRHQWLHDLSRSKCPYKSTRGKWFWKEISKWRSVFDRILRY